MNDYIESLLEQFDIESIVEDVDPCDYAEVVGKYYPATWEEPAEYPEIIGYDEYTEAVAQKVISAIAQFNIDIDDDTAEELIKEVVLSYDEFCTKFSEACDDYGFDVDYAYECWRDSQYEY